MPTPPKFNVGQQVKVVTPKTPFVWPGIRSIPQTATIGEIRPEDTVELEDGSGHRCTTYVLKENIGCWYPEESLSTIVDSSTPIFFKIDHSWQYRVFATLFPNILRSSGELLGCYYRVGNSGIFDYDDCGAHTNKKEYIRAGFTEVTWEDFVRLHVLPFTNPEPEFVDYLNSEGKPFLSLFPFPEDGPYLMRRYKNGDWSIIYFKHGEKVRPGCSWDSLMFGWKPV